MKHTRSVFGVLLLAGMLASCSDPVSPRAPGEEGGENPPTTALVAPASGHALG